jgi:ABC-type transport system substrate-binding protein
MGEKESEMATVSYWGRFRARRLGRRHVLRGGALGIAGLTLAGCAQTTAPPTSAPAAIPPTSAPAAAGPAPTPTAVSPKLGGTLKTMGTSPERNLEPHNSGGAAGGAIGALICYSNLLAYKWGPDVKAPSYIPGPDLAESWTQPDDLTLVFKLRPGAKFHNIAPVNGREVVAEDIIYSYNRVREQRSYAAFLAGIIKMEAVDKATFKITLDKPNTDILNNLAVYNLAIVAKERAEQTGGNLDDPPVIGSGPFLFESFAVNERLTVKRNPDYFLKGRPYIDGLEALRSVNDPSRMVTSFRAGAINFLSPGMTAQQAEDIKKAQPQTVVGYIPADRTMDEFMLNASLDLFKDIRIRQAIQKAVDRKAVIDTVFLGHARLTGGLSLPDPSYGLPDAELTRLYARDLDGARRLLREAGKESGISFDLSVSNALSGAFLSSAEIVQANLREVGIAVTLKPVDTPTYVAAFQSGSYQALLGASALGAPNSFLAGRFYTGGPTNYAKYSDPEMDKLIDQQAVLVKDPDGRKKLLQDIQRKIINDAVYTPLIMHEIPFVHAPELRDVYMPTIASGHSLFWTSLWFDK